jgi:FAD/FMN-containing dehydrogenase
MRKPPSEETLNRLRAVVGTKGWTSDAAEMAPHLIEERRRYQGAASIVMKPASTKEVSSIVKICAETKTPMVPQGGNTGNVGGQTPFEDGADIVICLSRMNALENIDLANNTVTVEAGVILADLQQAADKADRFFPLSLGAEGSCQIGGNLSSNAGGTGVLRYGNARNLALGLEVVLPDGAVLDNLRGLRKDNSGYDLKHLFIGGEGTLGVITRATLKLYPKPKDRQTAFVALTSVKNAVDLLAVARDESGDQVTSFELIAQRGLSFVTKHIQDTRDPFSSAYPWYVLMELSSGLGDGSLRNTLEHILSTGMNKGYCRDAVIAESGEHARAFWLLRETIPEAQKPEGGSIKHDVSVPVSAIPDLIARATIAAEDFLPGIRPVPFGHVGDGNIHLNFSQPIGMEPQAFLNNWQKLNIVIHDIVDELGGSISAEHGVGRLKRDQIRRYKSETEMDLMRRIKIALDPDNIMNPGKVLWM